MLILLILSMLLVSPAFAGGRGGHYTGPFDANLFPGATVTTINCVNNATTDINALTSFVTAGTAANPTRQVLYLTGTCDWSIGGVTTSWNNTLGGAGIQNVVVWGYGAKVNNIQIGGEGLPQTNLNTARITTVSAGSTSLQLVTNSDGTKLAVGQWVAVTGIQLQNGGYPPNFQFHEYELITALSGCGGSTTCTVTVNRPLTNSYKSTWPVYAPGSSSTIDYGGPASIYIMGPSWNTNQQIYGLTYTNLPPLCGQEVNIIGRNIAVYDMPFQVVAGCTGVSGPAPSTLETMAFYYCATPGVAEVDKNI
jgi:hypothetical protein